MWVKVYHCAKFHTGLTMCTIVSVLSLTIMLFKPECIVFSGIAERLVAVRNLVRLGFQFNFCN